MQCSFVNLSYNAHKSSPPSAPLLPAPTTPPYTSSSPERQGAVLADLHSSKLDTPCTRPSIELSCQRLKVDSPATGIRSNRMLFRLETRLLSPSQKLQTCVHHKEDDGKTSVIVVLTAGQFSNIRRLTLCFQKRTDVVFLES